MNLRLMPIGKIANNEQGAYLILDKKYIPALKGLEGFSHIQVFWWFDGCDNEQDRSVLTNEKPYTNGPQIMGTFSTRSPQRPNPIAVSTVRILDIDHQNAVIMIDYIDAIDATPLLDIKPYTPSLDRAESAAVPEWCAHWPQNIESSADFDWESEFNF